MDDRQRRMPIIEALLDHQKREKVSLHVPGHKAGKGLSTAFARYLGPFVRLDLTELPGMDDLFRPAGCIADALSLAAEAFGTTETHFLVGGSTVGNMAAILSVVGEGDLALVGRNAHQSVWNALDLAGANRVAIMPCIERTGLFGAVSVAAVEEAIAAYPESVALILTSPTYYGCVSALDRIVELAHKSGMVVIVDEAHGAHLPFHPGLPRSAIAAGADLVVHSPHKMLASLTQTGLLHVCGSRISTESVRRWLRIVQSSSPSYLLLASLDAVRAQMAVDGSVLIESALQCISSLKNRIKSACASLVCDDPVEGSQDPFKWTLDARALGMTGLELGQVLRERFGIYVELCDDRHALFAWSYGNNKRDVERVGEALVSLVSEGRPDRLDFHGWLDGLLMPTVSNPLPTRKEMDKQGRVALPLAQAIGKRVWDPITVYPPGIPLLLPGEILTESSFQLVSRFRALGLRIDGLSADEDHCIVCE